MPETADPFERKSVRRALKDWDNSQALGTHPLARLKVVEARRQAAHYGETDTGYGVALREVLHATLERLKPAAPLDWTDKRWRAYLILTGQYLEGRSPDYLTAQFAVARSTYDHEQAQALEDVGSLLREAESQAASAPAMSPRRIFMAPAPVELVGRDGLLADLKLRLARRETVALSGLPGVGKTALAAQAALDLLEAFPDGVLWASLGRAPDIATGLGLWGAALGLPLENVAQFNRAEDRARLVHAAIGLRRLLLVIDDAWSAEAAAAFRLGGPNCACLLTTRMPHVAADFAGPAATTVPELSQTDGLALLRHYGLAEQDGAAALVLAVGGLPLALSIAGRYLQKEARRGQPRRLGMAVSRLQRIGETLALTEPNSPLAAQPEMPLSVLAVIALTDDALSPDSRAALRALSAFPPKPNTFDEAAALAVTGLPAEALDSLVDYGLLEGDRQGRYTLHPTVSQYARLSADDTGPFEARLAAHYISGLIAEAEPSDLDSANILAALTAASKQGMRSELINGADSFYTIAEARGTQAPIEADLQNAIEAARYINDRRGLARCLNHLARLRQRRGDAAAAEAGHAEALALARGLKDPDAASAALSGLGMLAFNQGDYARSGTCYEEALTLARDNDLRQRLAGLLANYGALRLTLGDLAGAENCFLEGLGLARVQNSRARVGALLINLGVLSARRGDRERADACFQESLELARGAGNREQTVFLLTNLGTLANESGQTARAMALFQEALELARALEDPARISQLLANLGALACARGAVDESEAMLAEGLGLAQLINQRDTWVQLLVNFGELEKRRGRLGPARRRYEEARTLAVEIQSARLLNLIDASLAALTPMEDS